MKHIIVKLSDNVKTSETELFTLNGEKYYILTDKLVDDIVTGFNDKKECYEVAGYLKQGKLNIFDEKLNADIGELYEYIAPILNDDNTIYNYNKISFIGDSITYGMYATIPPKNYVNLLGKRLKITTQNYGVSGSTLANSGYNPSISISHRLKTNEINISDSDIICVFAGTNDFAQGITLQGSDDNSVEGSVNYIIDTIKKKNNHAILFFVPPMWRSRIENPNIYEDIETVPNKNGIFFKEYYNEIWRVCNNKGIPILDLYHGFKINENNYKNYLEDGLHPNNAGHKLISDIMYDYIHAIAKNPNNMG